MTDDAPDHAIPGLDLLIARVAREHGTTPERVWSGDRHKHPTLARHHAWAVLRWTLDLSYPVLGEIFGVDQSTIRSGVLRWERIAEERRRNRSKR